MSNSKILSNLELNDIIQLESILYGILINIDSPARMKPTLINAGVDVYFIGQACQSGLKDSEYISILVSKFKDYSVSRKNPYHPLNQFLSYLLKEPQKYNLDDNQIETLTKILAIGQQKIEAFIKLPSNNKNQDLPSVKISGTPKSSSVLNIDVLIITALPEELKELKNCDNNSGKSWKEHQDSLGYDYYKTIFKHSNGSDLTIAAASAVDMGEGSVTELASRLITELKPRCLAMTGICAGNEEDVFLGDVIVADRVFKFDDGKLVAYYQEIEGQEFRTEEIFHDITTYNLKHLWKSKIQHFSQDWIKTIQTIRPKSYRHQERWLLHKLYDNRNNPETNRNLQKHPERATECPDWGIVIKRLREQELLKINSFELTEKGTKEVDEERLLHPDDERYQDPLIPQVKIGVIGTTGYVQKDPKIFERLKKVQRKALGVEMESVAIGAVARIREIPMIVVKSVQDYGDYNKNDQFRFYAAETSARFLLAFLTTSSAISDK